MRVRAGSVQPAASATAVHPPRRAAVRPASLVPHRTTRHGGRSTALVLGLVPACARRARQDRWRASDPCTAAAAAVRVLRSATARQPALLLPLRPTRRSPRDPSHGLHVDAGSDPRLSQAYACAYA